MNEMAGNIIRFTTAKDHIQSKPDKDATSTDEGQQVSGAGFYDDSEAKLANLSEERRLALAIEGIRLEQYRSVADIEDDKKKVKRGFHSLLSQQQLLDVARADRIVGPGHKSPGNRPTKSRLMRPRRSVSSQNVLPSSGQQLHLSPSSQHLSSKTLNTNITVTDANGHHRNPSSIHMSGHQGNPSSAHTNGHQGNPSSTHMSGHQGNPSSTHMSGHQGNPSSAHTNGHQGNPSSTHMCGHLGNPSSAHTNGHQGNPSSAHTNGHQGNPSSTHMSGHQGSPSSTHMQESVRRRSYVGFPVARPLTSGGHRMAGSLQTFSGRSTHEVELRWRVGGHASMSPTTQRISIRAKTAPGVRQKSQNQFKPVQANQDQSQTNHIQPKPVQTRSNRHSVDTDDTDTDDDTAKGASRQRSKSAFGIEQISIPSAPVEGKNPYLVTEPNPSLLRHSSLIQGRPKTASGALLHGRSRRELSRLTHIDAITAAEMALRRKMWLAQQDSKNTVGDAALQQRIQEFIKKLETDKRNRTQHLMIFEDKPTDFVLPAV